MACTVPDRVDKRLSLARFGRRRRRSSTCRVACKRSMAAAGGQSTSPLAVCQSVALTTIGKLANSTGSAVHIVGCLYLMWPKGEHEHLAGLVPRADACYPAEEIPRRRVRNREHAKERHDGDSPAVSGVSVFSKRAVRMALRREA